MSGGLARAGARASLALVVFAIAAAPAAAQRVTRSDPKREVTFAATWVGPVTFSTTPANLLRPDGGTLPLFTTTNGLAPGVGADIDVGLWLTRSITVEGTAGWSRTNLRTRVTGDFEGAADTTVTETIARFAVEGSALWTFARRGHARYFARGGAGWMNELVGDATYHARGIVGNAGVGMKYWCGNPRPGASRIGLRVEGRAVIRDRGVSLGGGRVTVAAVAAGGIVFGF